MHEALTNVHKHSSARRADVRIRYDAARLHLDISDDGRPGAAPDTAGHGLTGMRERVALLGGTLHAGPISGRTGWLVAATLPVPDRA